MVPNAVTKEHVRIIKNLMNSLNQTHKEVSGL